MTWRRLRWVGSALFPLMLLLLLFAGPVIGKSGTLSTFTAYLPVVDDQIAPTPTTLYLPIVRDSYPWTASPYGFEGYVGRLAQQTLQQRARDLGASWYRVNDGISWRAIQPYEGAPYDWSSVATLEADLIVAARLGIRPIVIVDDSPYWATIQPTSCGAIRQEYFGAYAAFLHALVERYSQPPYNVRYWELGNEVDVDPSLIPPDNHFGCWGNIQDPYYGGEHYGEMLKVVYPAIKQADPTAKVLIGGLLMDRPVSANPEIYGHPEHFFEGILRSGAGPYFDIVAYHGYPSYGNIQVDYDLFYPPWASWGGITIGKARYLQAVMARYGVQKPLFLNETSLLCPPPHTICEPVPEGFLEAQADHLVRTFSRSLAGGVDQLTWFTLNGPGWRASALLDQSQNPRPVYGAYQQLIRQTKYSQMPPTPVSYAPGIEAYRFLKRDSTVDILWTIEPTPQPILIPKSHYIAAYTRDDSSLQPLDLGAYYQVTVGFSPIYLIQRR